MNAKPRTNSLVVAAGLLLGALFWLPGMASASHENCGKPTTSAGALDGRADVYVGLTPSQYCDGVLLTNHGTMRCYENVNQDLAPPHVMAFSGEGCKTGVIFGEVD